MANKDNIWIKEDTEHEGVFLPSQKMKEKAHISDSDVYKRAKEDPVGFWSARALKEIDWFKKFEKAYLEEPPYFHWFIGGETNICYNAVDRHLPDKEDETALIWVPENPKEDERNITYGELHEKVCKFANALKNLGVEKGDVVTFWLPMIPETAIAALACQRIGALHSIIYTAFSPNAVEHRMKDAGSELLITADGLYRRGKVITLKEKLNEKLEELGARCVVVGRADCEAYMREGEDFYFDELMENSEDECEVEHLNSEDTSFLLYTSGTTGKPKGIRHSVGGYMVQAALTTKYVFDFHENDVFFSTADIGWITGHSYTLYGPLLLGGTTLWYEGAPDYPDMSRWWDIIEEHGVNQFYTAPTALRMLRKGGHDIPSQSDLSSLRVMGSVGEPIDPDTWNWYFEEVGGGRCPIVDTYWQTETGGILLTSLPGIGPFVPGVAGVPLPPMNYDILDEEGNSVEPGSEGKVVIKPPFAPGMLRGVYRDTEKYKEEYWSEYGDKVYFAGDGGIKKKLKVSGRNLIKIIGRIDDVMEVAGHRLGTAEMEDAVSKVEEVVEVAVVGMSHEVKGEVPAVFVILHKGVKGSEEIEEKIVHEVRGEVGPVATPGAIYFVKALPSTESGKIIRRFLKSLLNDEELGDMTTAKNPECLKDIAELVDYEGPQKIPGYN